MLPDEDKMLRMIPERYHRDFDTGRRLLQFATVLLSGRPIPTNSAATYAATAALLVMAVKVLRGILVLCEHGLGEPALMMLRPLSEAFASAGYISAADPPLREERAESYLAGEVTEQFKWVVKLVRDSAGDSLPAEVASHPELLLETLRGRLVEKETAVGGAAGAEERASKKLEELKRQRGWADIPYDTMFREAQGKLAYPLVFKFAAGVLHARRPGMFVGLTDAGEVILKLTASEDHVPMALGWGNALFVGVLAATNRALSLKLETSIDSFLAEVRATAESRRQDRS